jgi:hypothetical protein
MSNTHAITIRPISFIFNHLRLLAGTGPELAEHHFLFHANCFSLGLIIPSFLAGASVLLKICPNSPLITNHHGFDDAPGSGIFLREMISSSYHMYIVGCTWAPSLCVW